MKPALRPTDLIASSPIMKSQFEVWGATHMMAFGKSGTVTSTFHPAHFNILAAKFIIS